MILTNRPINPPFQLPPIPPQHTHIQISIGNGTGILNTQPPFDGLAFVGVAVGIEDGIAKEFFGEGTDEFMGIFVVVVVG